jgi:hypothetical protein
MHDGFNPGLITMRITKIAFEADLSARFPDIKQTSSSCAMRWQGVHFVPCERIVVRAERACDWPDVQRHTIRGQPLKHCAALDPTGAKANRVGRSPGHLDSDAGSSQRPTADKQRWREVDQQPE